MQKTQIYTLAVRQHFGGGWEDSIFWYAKYFFGTLKDIKVVYFVFPSGDSRWVPAETGCCRAWLLE